jgi:hypothetical protein
MTGMRNCICKAVMDEHEMTEEDAALLSVIVQALTWSRETFEFARDHIKKVSAYLEEVQKHDRMV